MSAANTHREALLAELVGDVQALIGSPSRT